VDGAYGKSYTAALIGPNFLFFDELFFPNITLRTNEIERGGVWFSTNPPNGKHLVAHNQTIYTDPATIELLVNGKSIDDFEKDDMISERPPAPEHNSFIQESHLLIMGKHI
jgi:hypothetical protein